MYKGKKITIMGLGLQGSGIAVAKYFSKKGANVIVTDIKTKDKLKVSIDKLRNFKNIKFVLGQHRPEDFLRTDLVIKGPGVSWNSKYLELSRKNNISIETEAGLFAKDVKNPLIGVTGTRGKSTTAQLIYEIIKYAGKDVLIGGNISGKPLISVAGRAKKKSTWLVLELSSFQLEGMRIHRKSPKIAVVTNLMSDHLNRYRSIEEYHNAKKSIVEFQNTNDFAVINHDDEKLREWTGLTKANVWFFSKNRLGSNNVVFLDKDVITARVGGFEEEFLSLSNIKLIGKHRIENILAAISVALILKIPKKIIKEAVQVFNGLEHRLEIVREVDGVLFINDTTASVPEAAIMGIRSFNNVVLIAGGADKKLDFTDFAKEIVKKTKKFILLPGEGSDRLAIALRKIDKNLNYLRVGSLSEAVLTAKRVAKPGDVVLLSPGCSSFGLFNNEFERGDQFKEEAMKL